MVTLSCFTDAELLWQNWQHAKISLLWQQGSVGVQFERHLYIAPSPKIPHFGYKNLAFISYIQAEYSQFYVQMVNFSLP